MMGCVIKYEARAPIVEKHAEVAQANGKGWMDQVCI